MVLFTVEPASGFCNNLKAFITALSIGDTNIRCRKTTGREQPKSYEEIFNSKHIHHDDSESGQYYTSCRFRILESEDADQQQLTNELWLWDPLVIHAGGKEIRFANKTIDWFFDRALICDKVFNRIMGAIDSISWQPQIIFEVEKEHQKLIHPVLAVSIRTWTYKFEEPNLTSRTDEPCKRVYNFETYRDAIMKFLPEAKTILLSTDNDDVLPEYTELLKNHNVVIYKRPPELTENQYAAIKLLLCAKADFLVCSRLSTYSECIWWFSRCRQKVIPLF